MNNSEIIKLIESSNSRLFKESIILEQMEKGNDIFFKGLSFAYNKLLTFGVKQLPVAEKNGQGLDWIEFSKICEKLIKRELTGYAARDQIIILKDKSHKDEWNFFYRRILQKDILCLKFNKEKSYWIEKNNVKSKMKNQF